MSRIANDADVGRDPLAGEGDSLEIMTAGQGEVAGRGCCRAPAGEEIALEPQPIVPPAIATPPDHLGGSVEAVGDHDPTASPRGFRRVGRRAGPPERRAASRRPPRATPVAWRSRWRPRSLQ